MGTQGASIGPLWVVTACIHHPGGELHHLFVVKGSPMDLVLLGIDFGGKAGFMVNMDGPSIWIT